MMRTLEYQERVLATLNAWLDALRAEKDQADKVAEVVREQELDLPIPDFAEKAWKQLRQQGRLPVSRANVPYSPRKDGIGNSVPNAVLKIPTGGGKTWLAVNATGRILGRYLERHTGFVLWIVPNEAIYSQTLKRFRDRDDPYRQMLDRISAGRTRILEKADSLHARDVEENLCVMLLMLQSANRQTKETLRMFRDRGDVHSFTPPEGEQQGHKALLEEIPNLDVYDLADSPVSWPLVKDSLGNALRIIRPVVVLDEGHKATTDLAYETLYGFNPALVLELTATPHDVKARGGKSPRSARYANVLAEVSGLELDREGMIKMPINLDSRQEMDWRETLRAALQRLQDLQQEAERYHAENRRYIRPIMLVQVERTGADQRDGMHVHAKDVKEWLLQAGLDEAQIAIKTAETNDLNQPENQDLLSPANRVRVIITKQALQEGWDCPFAYILCSLSASQNEKAMTQLIGRILRQPHALKTGVPALDECWVITHHADTARVVRAVKEGLERDGLGDLVLQVAQDAMPGDAKVARKINRRKDFNGLKIFLPKVLVMEGERARELDYETDILAAIGWRNVDTATIAEKIPENAQAAMRQVQRIQLVDDDDLIAPRKVVEEGVREKFDPAYAVRMIADFISNAFIARDVVGGVLHALRQRGFDEARLGQLSGLIIETLRRELEHEQLNRAEDVFKQGVRAGRIRFRLQLDGLNWAMPQQMETTQPDNARQLLGKDGGPLRKSLFAPVYEDDLNAAEREVAVYLDAEKALKWWHRNVARSQHGYGVQGWRRGRIYPDFIFSVRGNGEGRLVVLETKGDQLAENLDTVYKRDLLEFLTKNFCWEKVVRAGELKMEVEHSKVECVLILMSEWKSKLPRFFEYDCSNG